MAHRIAPATRVRILGAEMRLGRAGYLVVFFAAMFLANNVAAAARACIQELTEQGRQAVARDHDRAVFERQPRFADESPCLGRCVESAKYHPQELAIDVPGVEFTPQRFVLRVAAAVEPGLPRIASLSPLVGPRLNILFGNLRN